MRPLTVVELLNLWEAGLHHTLIEKSLHLLCVACSVPDIQTMAGVSIGERDARLLQLRAWMFGTQLSNMAYCPACSQPVEWETNLRDLQLQPAHAETRPNEFDLGSAGFSLRFRLLNSLDLMAATGNTGVNAKQLLSGCILKVQHEQQDCGADDLPDEVFEALDKRLDEEDPQADIQMMVNCPACAHEWHATFDILSYLWVEIDSWAKHMLQEVSVLARAFGWSERDILNMSTQRRQLYLEMTKS